MNNSLEKYTVSFGLGLVITILFSALLVVVKELSENTLAAMKTATGHHWLTHTFMDVILFFTLGLLLKKVQISPESLSQMIIGATIIGGLIIAGFYLFVG